MYIDNVPGNQIPIPAVYNFSIHVLLFYFSSYAYSNEQINADAMLPHIFNKKIWHLKVCSSIKHN